MKSVVLFTLVLTAMAGTTEITDLYKPGEISEMGQKLAAKSDGFASEELKRYSNHYTMLAYRAKTGSAEIHQHEADFFVVQKGHGSILLGGKMIGGKQQKPGELRGTSIEGAEKRPLGAGDIIHIPAGVPHQILVTAGDPITYFVVKVTGQ